MRAHNKLYTVLKIDEGSNLGAIRIRLRSLKAAVEERDKKAKKANLSHIFNQTPQFTSQADEESKEPIFTKDMKKKHTLLMPMLSPIHQNGLIEEAFKQAVITL
jgi:hypothetical protein